MEELLVVCAIDATHRDDNPDTHCGKSMHMSPPLLFQMLVKQYVLCVTALYRQVPPSDMLMPRVTRSGGRTMLQPLWHKV